MPNWTRLIVCDWKMPKRAPAVGGSHAQSKTDAGVEKSTGYRNPFKVWNNTLGYGRISHFLYGWNPRETLIRCLGAYLVNRSVLCRWASLKLSSCRVRHNRIDQDEVLDLSVEDDVAQNNGSNDSQDQAEPYKPVVIGNIRIPSSGAV